MALSLIAKAQAGFRLFDGTFLNKIINNLNSVSVSGGSGSLTSDTTVTGDTITAAILLSGLDARSGPTANFTDTTDTGTNLDLALAQAAQTGQSFTFIYKNTTNFTATIAGGTGVTLSGRTTIPANSVVQFLFTRTGVAAWSMFGIGVIQQAIVGANSFIATADNGTTQTLTAAMIVGGNITYHTSAGGSTPSLTLPLATAIDTALPDIRPGQSYTLRVINTNSGTATIVTNTGWTLTGTLTLATETWRDFVVTKTGTGTYTGVSVGTGTNS
jgi:hypothetical protein